MKMRRRTQAAAGLLLGALLLGGLPERALAETYYGDENWQVAFTAEKAMDSSFTTADLSDTIMGLQPGDTAELTLRLRNDNETATDWYMTNKVLYSLEDRSANGGTTGGAYTYYLSYTDADGEETVLFDSDTVGGDDVSPAGEGLKEATSSLEDFFYLDTLTTGRGGLITLRVSLDGETQGNDYQDTLADLQMNFAVELNDTPEAAPQANTPGRNRDDIVRTGDESRPVFYTAMMGASGLVLLLLALYLRRGGRKERKGAA